MASAVLQMLLAARPANTPVVEPIETEDNVDDFLTEDGTDSIVTEG
jgi:hypothetical protein